MGRMPTREQILEALKVVVDPELRQDIVTLGMVRSIKVSDNGVVDATKIPETMPTRESRHTPR